MNEEQLIFCEKYENHLKTANLLHSIRESLTSKGEAAYRDLMAYLDENLDRYLSYQGGISKKETPKRKLTDFTKVG